MQAYHNDPKVKESVLAEMASHRKADTLVQGYGYWKDGKGCAVGCLIKSGNHSEYEKRFGIPQLLARLKDRIFEGLPKAEAREWPEQFLNAIKPGADLSSVWPKFAIFMLVDKDHGVLRFAKKDKTKKAIQDIADLYQRIVNGEKIDANTWLEARRYAAAYAAYAYAADAADAAAYAAYAADAAAYAAYAADAAAYAAAAYAYAADAAYADAAAYAAYAAAADADAADAADAARSRHYVALANKLVQLLEETNANS